MKRVLFVIFLISMAVGLMALDVTVLSLSGSVEIKEPGGGWQDASVGQVVSSRSMISTGFGSRAKLSAGGMELSLSPLTRVSIDSLTEEQGVPNTALSLQAGRVRATRPPATRQTRRELNFRVSTPVATAAVRGTDFFLSPDKLVTNEGLVELSQGQAVVLSPAGSKSWAVPGIRPINPIDLVSEDWGLASDEGRSSASKRGYARIILD